MVTTKRNCRAIREAGTLPPDTLQASISRQLLFSPSKHQSVHQGILPLS